MTLRLKGYLRTNPGGAAVSGVTVSLLDVQTDLAPATTAFTNLSGTTSVTDGTGAWEFTMDLNPVGPLRVQADVGGGNLRHRRQDELFQYDGYFINQLPESLAAFTSGILRAIANEFLTTASATRVLTIQPGLSLIQGFPLGWDSGNKTITGAANGSGSTRYDFLVLRQWYTGAHIGKQDIVLVQGGATTDPVVTSTESDLTKFIRGATIWDLPIYRAKLASGGTVYTLDNLVTTHDYTYANPYREYQANSMTFGNDVIVADDLTTEDLFVNGQAVLGNTAGDIHTLYGHIETAGTSPSVSTAASAVCTAATQSISQGSDTQFTVTGTSKSPPIAGSAFVITFAQDRLSSNYSVGVTARSSDASDGHWYVTSKGTSGFTISCNNVLASGATITLDVQVI